MKERSVDDAAPIYFGEKLASSQAFAGLFRDGMALVEETAAYLDGPGRQESKKLERSAALAYATESMRLTTRLMQLASWLLLHQARGQPHALGGVGQRSAALELLGFLSAGPIEIGCGFLDQRHAVTK